MTRPAPEAVKPPTAAELRQLVRGVGELAHEVKGLADAQATDRGQQRRDRLRTYVVGFVAVVAMAAAALGVNGQLYQNCRNKHADAFTAAETAKVCGQVRGLAQIVPQTKQQQTRIKVRCGGVPPANPDPRTGIAQFEEASLNYLDAINSTGTKC